MNKVNEPIKRKIKDPFFQVSESFFEKIEIIDLMSKYGYEGVGIYLKISLMLLKNQGSLNYDWKYISNKKRDKEKIEDIITNSGLFTLSADGASYSSSTVTEQLDERGKISLLQSNRSNKRWQGDKATTTEQTAMDTNIIEVDDLDRKPKFKRLTNEEFDELNRIDGIKSK